LGVVIFEQFLLGEFVKNDSLRNNKPGLSALLARG